MLQKNFHIQRGDDVTTPPKNDQIKSFNFQSKWGPVEFLILADGASSQPGANQLTGLAVQKSLDEFRGLAKLARSLEDALALTLQKVHQEILKKAKERDVTDDQSVELLIAVINGEKISLANTGGLAAYLVKGNEVQIASGLKATAESFGQRADFEAEVVGPIALAKGDDLVLASDGIHGGLISGWKTIRKEELLETLKNEQDLKRAAKRLVSYPLGRNIEEDISVAIIRNPKKERTRTPPLLIPIVLGLAVLAFFAYRSFSSAPDVPDNGRAVVVDSSGLVSRIDPADNSTRIGGVGEIPAGYSISVGENSSATLLVRNAELNVGPQTRVLFQQIEAELQNETEHVILAIETESWVSLSYQESTQSFTILMDSAELTIVGGGTIGINNQQGIDQIYCFRGVCSLTILNEAQALSAGRKAVVGPNGVFVEDITQEDLEEFELNCGCSLE